MNWFFLFSFSFLNLFFNGATNITEHPVYISKAELYYRPETKRIEIEVLIFADDLQKSLSTIHKEELEIGTRFEDLDKTTAYIKDYLLGNFQVYGNDKLLPLSYVGREMDGLFDLYLYWEIDNVDELNYLEVYNSILHDFEPSQENIIILHAPNGPKRGACTKGNTSFYFEL